MDGPVYLQLVSRNGQIDDVAIEDGEPRSHRYKRYMKYIAGILMAVLVLGLSSWLIFFPHAVSVNQYDTTTDHQFFPVTGTTESPKSNQASFKPGSASPATTTPFVPEYEREGDTAASLEKGIMEMFYEMSKNGDQLETSKSISTSTVSNPLLELNKEVDEFQNELVLKSSPSIKVYLTQLPNSTFVGNVYVEPSQSPFNILFDTKFYSVSLLTPTDNKTICSKKNCYETPPDFTLANQEKTKFLLIFKKNVTFGSNSQALINNATILGNLDDPYANQTQTDGVFGLNSKLAKITTSSHPVDQFFLQNSKFKKLFSIWYSDSMSLNRGGEITFGSIDPTRFSSTLKYLPVVSNAGWEVRIASMNVNSEFRHFTNSTAIFDSASAYIQGPREHIELIGAFLGFANKGNNEFVLEDETSCKNYAQNYNVSFQFDQVEMSFTGPELIEKGPYGKCRVLLKCNAVGDDNWSFGVPFFKKYYTVFDIEKQRIGFAPQLK